MNKSSADQCRPMLELFKEEGERRHHWEADLIILKELWQPLIRGLLDTFNQRDTQRPWSLCVYGGTLSGKTTFFNHAIEVFKEYKDLDRYGIIKISCLTNSTLKGIYKDILMGLTWPFSSRDSIQDLEVLVGDAVQKQECKLIIIDEFNQLYNKGDGIRVAEVLKALRNIPNRTLRPLVVVGTMTVQSLLKQDRETNSRFRKIEFPCFQSSPNKCDLFREAVYALDQNLKETTGIDSNFANRKSILQILFNESQRKMGALVKIYEETVRNSMDKKAKELDYSHLQEAVATFHRNDLVNEYEILEPEI